MIIYRCDICKTEIKDLAENGEFKIQEKKMVFIKHQQGNQIVARGYLFCPKCARETENYIKTIATKEE